MPFVVAQKETRALRSVVVLTLSIFSVILFFSLLLEEINLAPLLRLAGFPWPFLCVLFQKGKALQPEQFALQSHARGDVCLSCFITGGLG